MKETQNHEIIYEECYIKSLPFGKSGDLVLQEDFLSILRICSLWNFELKLKK